MIDENEHTRRFGGPGSSHQDREHPGRNGQTTGKKGGGEPAGTPAPPGAGTNPDHSRVSGGGGERDRHHTHTEDKS